MKTTEYLGPREVAELLEVNPMTVRRMSDKGVLPFKTTPGGHRRYRLEDIGAYCKENGIELAIDGEKSRRILIVDDDPQILEMLVLFLRKFDASIEVETAIDGFDAGLKVSSFKPSVIVTDIMMPKLNGIEVCQRIKSGEDTKHISVVGITGSDNNDLINEFLIAGGQQCLTKPIKRAQFTALVGELL